MQFIRLPICSRYHPFARAAFSQPLSRPVRQAHEQRDSKDHCNRFESVVAFRVVNPLACIVDPSGLDSQERGQTPQRIGWPAAPILIRRDDSRLDEHRAREPNTPLSRFRNSSIATEVGSTEPPCRELCDFAVPAPAETPTHDGDVGFQWIHVRSGSLSSPGSWPVRLGQPVPDQPPGRYKLLFAVRTVSTSGVPAIDTSPGISIHSEPSTITYPL